TSSSMYIMSIGIYITGEARAGKTVKGLNGELKIHKNSAV
ncbi:unnamed protein product, partial [marine sediment metagenome]